ncbi:MAG: DUF1015 domain-containing protein [Planctomycetaceae bacterium]|nr:DUF1015 domain-containing protein [Planctomycetaceae bacterium]
MPRIKPFQALRPRPELASKVASVPYDVVNRDEAAALAEGNPLSFLHVVRPDIDFPPEKNPYDPDIYEKASANFQKLIQDGVLFRDTEDCLFAYRQIMNGRAQVGIVCCVHIDDYENNLILKHEKTRKSKEDDRTRHVLALNANAGPVFLTYRGEEEINFAVAKVVESAPLYDFVAVDGVQHTVWRIPNAQQLVTALSAVPVFYIADGHHRAASAWRAGNELRRRLPGGGNGTEECNWFLSVLFPSSQLRILAYNRILKDLNGLTVSELLEKLDRLGELEQTNNPVPDAPGSFCFFIDRRWWKLTIPPDPLFVNDPIRSLDVSILEHQVLQPIFGIEDVRTDSRIDFVGGIRGTAELERLCVSVDWEVAISMYPTTLDQLMTVSDAGEIMPPKSTWFEPKLRSGLLVHTLE